MKTQFKFLITVFLLPLFWVDGFAQDEYVILTGGDSIFGNVSPLDELSSCHMVELTHADGSTDRYRARSVKEYVRYINDQKQTFIQSEVWEAGLMWPKTVLLRVVVEGELTLLEYIYERNTGGQTGFSGGVIRVDQFLAWKGKPTLIRKKDFGLIMSEYVKKQEPLAELVKNNVLDYSDLPAIVQLYNGNIEPTEIVQGFDNGYVVLANGEKLKGRLKRLDPRMSCFVVVFIDEKGQPRLYDSSSLNSYKRGKYIYLKQELIWGPRKTKYSSAFMRLVSDGYVKILNHVFPAYYNKNAFEDYRADVVNSKLDRADLYLEKDGILILVSSNNFKKEMPAFFADHPRLPGLIKKRKLIFEDLRKVVDEYNSYKLTQNNNNHSEK